MTENSIKCKVELHIHFDGAFRAETIMDVSRKRGLELPVDNVRQLKDFLSFDDAEDPSLVKFLRAFHTFLPIIGGDRDVIRQCAIEFCEDQANRGVLYTEARYSPHCLSNTYETVFNQGINLGNLSPEGVVECILAGFKEGSKRYGIQVKSILCCLRGFPEWSQEILELCKKYRNQGVVGMDIAGDETQDIYYDDEFVKAFQEAKACGIRRTAHAGEAGHAINIQQALDWLSAERIGHGYHLVEDEELYARIKKENVHLELCPTSSIVTGVWPTFDDHPIKRFICDNLNFSINSDDPLIIGHGLDREFSIVHNWDYNVTKLTRATFNAARSCFLSEEEKKDLIARLEKIYGIRC